MGPYYVSEVKSLFGYPNIDMSCLSKHDLKELDISYNRIENVSILSGMQNLTELSLDNNLVSDLSPLKNLSALNECSAYEQGFLVREQRMPIQRVCLN